MLKVFSCTAGRIVHLSSIGWDLAPGTGSTGSGRWLWSPALGPFEPVSGDFAAHELLSYAGHITTSPKDAMGERSCTHRKPDGTLMLPTFSISDDPSNQYDSHCYTVSGLGAFSDLVAPEIPVEHFCDHGGRSFYYDRTVVSGRNVVTGMMYTFLYRGSWRVNMYMYRYTFNQDWTKYIEQEVHRLNYFRCYSTGDQDLKRELQYAKPTTVGVPASKSTSVVMTNTRTSPVVQSDLDRLLRMVKNKDLYSPLFDTRPKDVFGDLAQRCADSFEYCSVNAIAFIRELHDWRKMIPKVSSLLNVKSWADWYLNFRYGVPLTVKDLSAYVKAFKDSIDDATHRVNRRPRVAYASTSNSSMLSSKQVNSVYHYKVIVGRYPSALMNLVRSMKEFGLYPTLTNAWDLIPYSFVVDWFYQIDHLLTQLDDRIFWQYYDVLSVVRSEKHILMIPGKDLLPDTQVLGDLTVTAYRRQVKHNMDMPRLRLDSPTEFHNYVDFAALIVQKKK